MAVLETLYPTSDVSAGDWSPSSGATLYAMLDEAGSHDGDTTRVFYTHEDEGNYDSSSFEVHIGNPSNWAGPSEVRDSESWNSPTSVSVRDAESWKDIKALHVREGEAWEVVVPQVVIRVNARHTVVTSSTFDGQVTLLDGVTVIDAVALDVSSTSYQETVLTVSATDLFGVTPSDLRVRIEGGIDLAIGELGAEIRVTQIKFELTDGA